MTFDSYIPYYALAIVFVIYALYACARGSLPQITDNKSDYVMTVGYTGMMKGIAAFLIIFAHYTSRMSGVIFPFTLLGGGGAPGVTIFLFISGYAETYQLMKKGNSYFHGFIKKKICRIYIPWVIVTALFAALFRVTDTKILLQSFFTFRTIYRDDAYNWFVIYILVCYLTLFIWGCICERTKENPSGKNYLIVIGAVSLLWFVICYTLNLGIHWYGNSFTFLFGCLAATYRNSLMRHTHKHRIFKLFLFAFGFCVFFLFSAYFDTRFLVTIARIGMSLTLSLFTWQLSLFVYKKNDILGFLGSLSLEIFFLGTGFLIWYYENFPARGYGVDIVIFTVVVVAYLVRRVTELLSKLLLKAK